jgi:molybdopterin-guanine dinucleotide biosynthesis protein B
MIKCPIPLLGFTAWSGTGKTTLLIKLLPILKDKGIKVGLIKHAHHQFEIDVEGKDSYELRKSGAEQVLVTSKNRWALLSDRTNPKEPELQNELKRFNLDELDIMLIEGFKHECFHKIEIHRPEVGKALIYPDDKNIIAFISPVSFSANTPLPTINIDDIDSVAEFVINYLEANR